MKSKVLKIRNLPSDMQVLNEIKVKPIGSLLFLVAVAGIFIISGSSIAIVGVVLLAVSAYALLVMPDRLLMQFTSDYLVLYNRKNRDECMLIWWDEIVAWQYQKHNNEDTLWLELIDGHVESIECFNRGRVVSYFKVYASGKERQQNPRRRRAPAENRERNERKARS